MVRRELSQELETEKDVTPEIPDLTVDGDRYKEEEKA